VVVAGDRLAAALPADPPPPAHRQVAFHYCFVPEGKPLTLTR
jgi:hypothetical protein